MPRIPIYDENAVAPVGGKPFAQQLNLSQRDAYLLAGGSNLDAVGEIAKGLQIIEEKKEEARVLEKTSLLTTAVAQHHAELESMKGADASEIVNRNSEFWNRFTPDLEKDLTPREREKFRAVVARSRDASQVTAIKLKARGEEAYFDTSTEAAMSSAKEAAAADPVNIDNVRLQASTYKMTLSRVIARKGLKDGKNGDVATQYTLQKMTEFHGEVLKNLMLAEDVNAAKGYYYSNIREISTAARPEIEKRLKTGLRAQLAQEVTDELFVKYGPDGEGKAIDDVRKNFSGDDEKAILGELQAHYSDVKRTTAAAQKKALDKLIGIIDTKGPSAYSAVQKTEEFMALDDAHKNALFDAVNTRRRELRSEARAEKLAASGGLTATERRQVRQEEAYAKLVELANTKPSEFGEIDLNMYTADLSSDMRRELKTVQDNLAQGGGKKLTEAQMLSVGTELAKAAGVSGKGVFEFRAKFREEVEAETQATGKQPSRQRVREIANELLTEGTIERSYWFDSKTRKFKAAEDKPFVRRDGAVGAKLVSEIPQVDRDQVVEALRAKRIPVTSENILRLYNRTTHGAVK